MQLAVSQKEAVERENDGLRQKMAQAAALLQPYLHKEPDMLGLQGLVA